MAAYLEKMGKPMWWSVGFLLLLGVAYLDFTTGSELSFSLFYFLPIAFFSWAINGTVGIVIAVFSAAIWLLIEMATSANSAWFVHIWNAIIRLGFFLLPATLLRSLQNERVLARTDHLTGAMNHRHFNELLAREIERSFRYNHSYTVAFIDLDNFKSINDTRGHTFGDGVLRMIAGNMKRYLRKTDMVARVGGDEFAILLPETDVQAARAAISNLIRKLSDEMSRRQLPVTFSVGVITLIAQRASVDEILSLADRAMYKVKNNGKNSIEYATFSRE
jgi:diguanylate cyclase (GGDEF)-like protein